MQMRMPCVHLVNAESPDGLFALGIRGGLPCAVCELVQGLTEEDSYEGYVQKNNSPPFGKKATKPKPFNVCISHSEPLCPFARGWIKDALKAEPASSDVSWMIATSPRDAFDTALDEALRAAGKPTRRRGRQ